MSHQRAAGKAFAVTLATAFALASPTYAQPANSMPRPQVAPLSSDGPTLRLEFDALSIVEQASIGLRHHSIDNVELPPDGVTIQLTCVAERAWGRFTGCTPRADSAISTHHTPAAITAAHKRVTAIGFEWPMERAQDQWKALVDIDVRLHPTDRVATGHPVDVRPFDEVDWERAPKLQIRFGSFRTDSLQHFPATMRTTCQIQSDSSLVCTHVEYRPDVDVIKRGDPFEDTTRSYASSRLKDGALAVGTWVTIEYTIDPARPGLPRPGGRSTQ